MADTEHPEHVFVVYENSLLLATYHDREKALKLARDRLKPRTRLAVVRYSYDYRLSMSRGKE